MQATNRDCPSDVGLAGNVPNPCSYLWALAHAAKEGDERPGVADDEGVVEKGLGDGGHALRGLGKGQEVVVAHMPIGPLVLRISKLPRPDRSQGESGRQRGSRDQGLDDGHEELGREALEGRADWARQPRTRDWRALL